VSDQPLDREMLIDLITKEVVSTLAAHVDRCETADGLRTVVVTGADRVAFHGNGAEVPVDLAGGGGYVLNFVHNIQDEVPPENVCAMFEAAMEYGWYGS